MMSVKKGQYLDVHVISITEATTNKATECIQKISMGYPFLVYQPTLERQ